METVQMDVKNAFLNVIIKRLSICNRLLLILIPFGSLSTLRTLHDVNQLTPAWFSKFSFIIGAFGLSSSPYKSALFIRKSDHGITMLLLHVDDIIITEMVYLEFQSLNLISHNIWDEGPQALSIISWDLKSPQIMMATASLKLICFWSPLSCRSDG